MKTADVINESKEVKFTITLNGGETIQKLSKEIDFKLSQHSDGGKFDIGSSSSLEIHGSK